jgi:hypothetical protein
MRPITLSCEETLNVAPQELADQILDLARWPEFTGFGVLPGVKSAEFERRTPEVVGTRVRVTTTDGSSHVEEIVEWQPDRRWTLHLKEFSAPLGRWATRFEEAAVMGRFPAAQAGRGAELAPNPGPSGILIEQPAKPNRSLARSCGAMRPVPSARLRRWRRVFSAFMPPDQAEFDGG